VIAFNQVSFQEAISLNEFYLLVFQFIIWAKAFIWTKTLKLVLGQNLPPWGDMAVNMFRTFHFVKTIVFQIFLLNAQKFGDVLKWPSNFQQQLPRFQFP
jgi:hypothetical protein